MARNSIVRTILTVLAVLAVALAPRMHPVQAAPARAATCEAQVRVDGVLSWVTKPLDFCDATSTPQPTVTPTPLATATSVVTATSTAGATVTPTPAPPSGELTTVEHTATTTSTTVPNRWRFTGAWSHDSSNSWSTAVDATASLVFSGDQVALYSAKDAHHGSIGVRIDNGPETLIDLYAATRNASALVYTSPQQASGQHTLTVRVTGTKTAASTGVTASVDHAVIAGSTAPTNTPIVPTATPVAPTATPQSGGASGFVQRNGNAFSLNGQPYRANGINYHAAISRGDNGPCWEQPTTEATWQTHLQWAQASGINVLRVYIQPEHTNSGADFSKADRILAVAEQHNMKVMLVLENQWIWCQTMYKNASWYRGGYKAPYQGNALAGGFREYVQKVVTRYQDDPRIFAWQIMNEAESKVTSDTTNSGHSYGNDDTQADSLYLFTQDIAGLIKSIDANHLVTLGVIGVDGYGGTSGNWYVRLHQLPTIDFATHHDYYESQDFPGSSGGSLPNASTCSDSLACNLARANTTLNKPFIVDEIGIKAQDAAGRTARAGRFDRKYTALYANGADGTFPWTLVFDGDGYQINPGDPAGPVFADHQ